MTHTQTKPPTAWHGDGMEDSYREYTLDDGSTVPSVTTILKPLFDPSMVQRNWIRDEVARLASLHSAGEQAKGWVRKETVEGEVWELVDVDAIDLLLDPEYIANAGLRKLGKRRDNGTLRHLLLEDYANGVALDEGQIESWAEERMASWELSCDGMDEVLPGLRQLWRWLEVNRPSFAYVEHKILTPDWGGTADMVGLTLTQGPDKGMTALVGDLKPEKITRSHLAQVAAYANGLGGGSALIVNVGPDKVGHRYVTQEECEMYYNEIFMPAMGVFLSKSVPLPKQKSRWA